jgi:hypothetical protein
MPEVCRAEEQAMGPRPRLGEGRQASAPVAGRAVAGTAAGDVGPEDVVRIGAVAKRESEELTSTPRLPRETGGWEHQTQTSTTQSHGRVSVQ